MLLFAGRHVALLFKWCVLQHRPETGLWATTFEYCRNKCRTSSKSTVHENAYLSTYHHCFSATGAPHTPSLPIMTT